MARMKWWTSLVHSITSPRSAQKVRSGVLFVPRMWRRDHRARLRHAGIPNLGSRVSSLHHGGRVKNIQIPPTFFLQLHNYHTPTTPAIHTNSPVHRHTHTHTTHNTQHTPTYHGHPNIQSRMRLCQQEGRLGPAPTRPKDACEPRVLQRTIRRTSPAP